MADRSKTNRTQTATATAGQRGQEDRARFRVPSFHNVAIGLIAAGVVGVYALALSDLGKKAPEEQQSAVTDDAAGAATPPSAIAGRSVGASGTPDGIRQSVSLTVPDHETGLQKPARVTQVSSTGKLSDLFKQIGYQLDGVRDNGTVPRLFLANLPADIRKISQPAERKVMFIKSTLPLILHVNELISLERARLIAAQKRAAAGEPLAPDDQAWLIELADLYGLERVDFSALLARVDIIPPSLAIAQAAEESGWGTSRFALEGNALFGQRSFKPSKTGIVPLKRAAGQKFKVRAFDHLIDGVKAYVHNLNSHFAYEKFRMKRAEMRRAGTIDGNALAGSLERYSERGAAYIKTIRAIMRVNELTRFDDVRLGDLTAEQSPDA